MTAFRPRRSVLYMPGANARALEKAKTLPADALILDLEDAVAPEAKPTARDQVVAAVRSREYGRREVVVRINGLDTEWGEADLRAAVAARPDAILVPKVSHPDDLARVAEIMTEVESGQPPLALWAMIETPMAILNIAAIAAVAQATPQRLAAFVMGTNDLARESLAKITEDRLPMLAWLSNCVAAARAYGIAIIDGVFNDFRDEEGLKRECRQGRDLGMDGKTLIHPNQIGPCNAIFSPDPEEVAMAEKIVAAFALPENADKGVITVEGRMVERLHLEMAQRTLAIAQALDADS